MRKLIINIFIILLIISVYKDLTLGTNISEEQIDTENVTINVPYDVIKLKIEPGDTVLTVVERINSNLLHLNVDQILQDFLVLNPTVHPNEIQQNEFYFFPRYKSKIN